MVTTSRGVPSATLGNGSYILTSNPPFQHVPTHDNIPGLEGEGDVADRLFTIPNVLTLSRLPLAIVLFACIACEQWLAGLIAFLLASVTDWLDGFLARKLNQASALGRNLDPLIDKVLTGGAFIYLMPVKGAELSEWMVTVVVGRELLITGIRGIMEAQGVKFGADWLGKLKMVLQCAVLIATLAVLWLRTFSLPEGV